MSFELLMSDSFFSDPFPLSGIEILQENTSGDDEGGFLDEIIVSSSIDQLESLSISQFDDYCAGLEVKTGNPDKVMTFSTGFCIPAVAAEATATATATTDDETTIKLIMQRSFSTNSFQNKHGFDVINHQILTTSPDTNVCHMRRACSTGDLQKMKMHTTTTTSALMEEEAANFKVGRYSAQERKQRIDRYRAKRTQRNFNKTIKYACRKTLADTRPRIRGRFARNDQVGDIPKTSTQDDVWTDRFFEEEEGIARRGMFFGYVRGYTIS